MQSRTDSLKENITKLLSGWLLMVLSQLLIFPHFNIKVSFEDDLLIAAYFTLIGFARSYLLRRYNNRKDIVRQKIQNRLQSLFEQFENVVIGYVVAVLSQLIIFPYFGIHITFAENLLVSIYFTFISVAKGYLIRRYYISRIANTYSQ